MKLFIIFIFMSIYLFAETYKIVGIDSNDYLSIRSGIGTNKNKIGELPYNAKGIKIIRCRSVKYSSNWCKVKSSYAGDGWVNSRFLKLTENTNDRYKVIHVQRYDILNIRKSSGTEYKIVGSLPYDAQGIQIQTCKQSLEDGLWCKINYNTVKGWVRKKFLSLENLNSNTSTLDMIHVKFDSTVKHDKVYFNIKIINSYKKYTRGGLSLSFPQFENGNGISIVHSKGFESLKKYAKFEQIHSNNTQVKMDARYLLVEGWSDHWNDVSERSISLSIDIENIDKLIIQIRAAVRTRYDTQYFPTTGPTDQQGYHTKQVVIRLKKDLKYVRDTSKSMRTVQKKECRDKPVLACSPSEKNEKAFSMCAISMGGCEVAVNALDNSNERYLASQACAALSSDLMGQKYTLDDMLGTFFVDSMAEGAKSQFDKGNDFFGFILAVGTVMGKASQLDQCIVNAKRNCTKEYNIWQRDCQ